MCSPSSKAAEATFSDIAPDEVRHALLWLCSSGPGGQRGVDVGTVVLADGDPDRAGALAAALRMDEHEVVVVCEGQSVLSELRERAPVALVLRSELGDIDPLEVCRQVRMHHDLPIVLYASDVGADGDAAEARELLALALGVDDYVPTPRSPGVLRARLAAVLRRSPAVGDRHTLELGDLSIDVDARKVFVGDAPVDLTRTEFELLVILASNPRRVVPRAELIERVWPNWPGDGHVLDVQLSRLRSKLVAGGAPRVAVPIPGVGYRLWDTAVRAG